MKALAAAGVVEGIPAEILDAQGGELYALAVVGAFVGCDTTAGIEMRKAMLASKMDERMLVVLDEMGAMLDSESETDVKQLQYNALRRSINKIPIYWGQCMPPSITESVMADVDARLNCTLSLIAAAEASSQEQRDDWEQLASLATSRWAASRWAGTRAAARLLQGLLRQHGPQLLARAPAHLVDAPGHLHHRRQLPHARRVLHGL